MEKRTIHIADFKRDSSFYPKLNILLTVKSFDLQAIRKRYLESKKNKSGRAGSVERREPGVGGIVSATIDNGKLLNEKVIAKMKEPRGIDFKQGLFAFSAENEVFLVKENAIEKFTDEWFSYIHTVAISYDLNKLLVSSSGLDYIAEYNLQTKAKGFEWLAWENGFSETKDPKTGEPVFLTRNTATAEQLKKEGKKVLHISNPQDHPLPTAMRAAFINSVTYDEALPGNLLATFFHEGAVYRINQQHNLAERIIDGMRNPHGGRNFGDKYMATSTATGQVIVQSNTLKTLYDFKRLHGKPKELGEMEWLQNATSQQENIIAIDSNRTGFVIFNPQKRLYDIVPYNNNWAVQDLVIAELTEEQIKLLSNR